MKDKPDIAVYVKGPIGGPVHTAYYELYEPDTWEIIDRWELPSGDCRDMSLIEAWHACFGRALDRTSQRQLELFTEGF